MDDDYRTGCSAVQPSRRGRLKYCCGREDIEMRFTLTMALNEFPNSEHGPGRLSSLDHLIFVLSSASFTESVLTDVNRPVLCRLLTHLAVRAKGCHAIDRVLTAFELLLEKSIDIHDLFAEALMQKLAEFVIRASDDHRIRALAILRQLLKLSGIEVRNCVLKVIGIPYLLDMMGKDQLMLKRRCFALLSAYCRSDGFDPTEILRTATAVIDLDSDLRKTSLECLVHVARWYDGEFRLPSLRVLLSPFNERSVLIRVLQLICLLSSRSVAIVVRLSPLLDLVQRIEADTDDVGYLASLAAHRIVKAQPEMILQIKGSLDIVQRMVAMVPHLSIRVRFHIIWILLYSAEQVDSLEELLCFIPDDFEQTFVSISTDILDMENLILTTMFLSSWDRLFTTSMCHRELLIEKFLSEFPGCSIWSYLTFSDCELSRLAEEFIEKWFIIDEPERVT